MTARALTAAAVVGLALLAPAPAASAADRPNVPANDSSGEATLTPDGRYVAFTSAASNLVPADTNRTSDVFVTDRTTGVSERVSVGTGGGQGDRPSTTPSISADGRYVAFTSDATDLVPDDSNGAADVFVRDRLLHTTRRVSLDASGGQLPWPSRAGVVNGNGRYVAFMSESRIGATSPSGVSEIYVRDRWTDTTQPISAPPDGRRPDGYSSTPTISADGRYVAFSSTATDLIPDDPWDRNGAADAFVHDRWHHTTRLASYGHTGRRADGPSTPVTNGLTADGRYLLFLSTAGNLVPADTNAASDLFVRDLLRGTIHRVDLSASGGQIHPDEYGIDGAISATGRYVTFTTWAADVLPGDTNEQWDVFVRDLVTGETELVSLSSSGGQGDRQSFTGNLSADGNLIAFNSWATNLVPGDTNWSYDVLLRDRRRGSTDLISAAGPCVPLP